MRMISSAIIAATKISRSRMISSTVESIDPASPIDLPPAGYAAYITSPNTTSPSFGGRS